jgi:hypothetical protein
MIPRIFLFKSHHLQSCSQSLFSVGTHPPDSLCRKRHMGTLGSRAQRNKVSMIGDRRGVVYVQFLMHSHSLTINAVRA